MFRATPRLLCTATQQKSPGSGSEEENGPQKPEQSSAEKALTEEKAQLEEQVKELTVSGVFIISKLHIKKKTF